MRVLFCDSGFSPREVDYMYAEEYQAARKQSIVCELLSFEALRKGDTDAALKRIKASEALEPAIYRGWMLRPQVYQVLYDALLAKKIQLINSPEEYRFAHYLPENYELLQKYTPQSTYRKLEGTFRVEDFATELDAFGDHPIVIKDYVKSQKHYWAEACFIPNAADRENVEAVIRRFLELQGPDFNEGLVFRAFVELEQLTEHSQSGMPLTKEFRVFVKNGAVIATYKYWDEGDYQQVEPVLDTFEPLLPKIKSNFFTMDIAKKKDGEWIIVELGDGQVAGLPENADKATFYKQLKQIVL